MKRYFLKVFCVLLVLTLSGCSRSCQKLDRQYQLTDKNIVVRHFSGGKLVRQWQFHGMVNNSEGSDGYYFTVGDTLYEVSGDVQILTEQ